MTRPYLLDEQVKDVQAVLAALGRPVVGVGIAILGGAGAFGYRRAHASEHPYP